jgi:type III pantothenate kinase
MASPTPSPLIAVDVGNSAIHFGLFTDPAAQPLPVPALWMRMEAASDDFTPLLAWLPPQSPPWVVASVNKEAASRLLDWITAIRPDVEYRVLDYAQMPLHLAIEHPHTAGLDRLAAAAAVDRLRPPGQPAVVVDFGTAITVDAVSTEGTFLGGAILPGMELAATALVAGTSQLPPVETEFTVPPRAIGKSTEPAIRAGIFWAAVGAVRALVEQATVELRAQPLVVVTGGAAKAVRPLIDPGGHFVDAPHLVLSGIAVAAQHAGDGT